MRYLPLLVSALVLAAPLSAQDRTVGPAPSILFEAVTEAAAAPTDSILVDDGVPQNVGAFLGFLGGGAAGYLISGLDLGGGDPTCSTDGPCGVSRHEKLASRVVVATIGAFAGMFIGNHLARARAPGS